MIAVPHAVHQWWRYSKLPWPRLLSNVITLSVFGMFLLSSRGPWHTFDIIAGVLLLALILGQLAWGAVNAERARRHGCW